MYRIKKIFVALLLLLIVSTHALAVAPLAVYGFTALAGAVFASYVHVMAPNLSRTIAFYTKRGAGFFINGAAATAKTISTNIFGAPTDSKNGVDLQLKTQIRPLAQHVLNNPTAYPGINKSLGNQISINPDSWGRGDAFNPSQLPVVGSVIETPAGNRVVSRVSYTCETMPLQHVNSSGAVVHGQSQPAGTTGYYNIPSQTNLIFVWTSCRGLTSTGLSSYGNAYNLAPVGTPAPGGNVDDYTQEQLLAAFASNVGEVVQAQADFFRSKNGAGPNTGSLPSSSAEAAIVDPQTGQPPSLAAIVAAADYATETVGDSDDTPVTTPPPSTTTTTTTQVRGQATVSVDPETGARTVTIPTTTTVTDSAGNKISEKTEYFIGTYPAGMSLPAEIQQAIDGAQTTITTSDSETTTAPPILANPDIAVINFQPLLNCKDLMLRKFPFSLVAAFQDFADDINLAPVRPEIVLTLGGEEMSINFQPFERFIYWARYAIGMMFIMWCVIAAFDLWIDG